MTEIWKDIKGYEGFYQISNMGRVKSLPRSWKINHWQDNSVVKFTSKEKILKPNISKRGYYVIGLCINGKSKIKNIHRIIAEAFIENPKNLKVINHKDGNKLNNSIENLEWCTQKENMQHAFKMGLVQSNKPIRQYSINGEYIKTWNSAAELFKKYHITNIQKCCQRKRNYSNGYIWRYESDVKIIGLENLNNEVKQLSKYIIEKQKKTELNRQKRLNKKPRKKPVLQYSLNNEFIKEWECAREIYNNLGFCYKNISNACLGKQKTAYGYIWKFKKKGQ